MPAFFSPLNHETLLQVSGADAANFLQGQATCDVREVDARRARPGAWCTPQGRVLADFLLLQLGPGHYGLRLRADIAEATAARLGKYIVFSKAELAPAGDWRVFGCWGAGAGDTLLPLVGELPRERHDCVGGEGFHLVQVDEGGAQFELYLDTAARADLPRALADTAQAGSADDWRALEIARGIGRVEAATVESFLPQALNYDLCDFVSFRKGCYTGQEVVARLHYRGQSKRRMYIARVGTQTPPAAGDSVYTAQEQVVGTVVNAVAAAAGEVHLLASVAEKSLAGSLRLGSGSGPELAISNPPYPLEAAP
ncbi:YgfZ/GcvT domain-containing protein [Parahaliea mediterranea]|uniref:Folate-binding protein YgfZ n=1 Tax=Parahaliea mediterranea TaxID=651086 RepID=A0A939DH29_9GAMM|nr:folate-binding protein YgfZ [Parahaliea mediterranea]MBN7798185.1 folate-binding protein YgfZ [Parahaliea mediterranea]